MSSDLKQTGFTLIELAVVLLVVSLLIGFSVAMVPVQVELQQYRAAKQELGEIEEALIAFAQVNGRLPCPDAAAAQDGNEDLDAADNDNCVADDGFLPGLTLGLSGDYRNGSLLDPWGQAYRYQVTADDDDGDGLDDFTHADEVQDVGMENAAPDLVICDSPTTDPADDTCTGTSNGVVVNVPAVVMSTGKDRGTVASAVQTENLDGDKVFIYQPRSDLDTAEYDDLVLWLAPNRLYSKMIEAGRLP